jgi:multidrug transporter EmrE-like cation transporter
MSVQNRNIKNLIFWQVIGNLSGFLSVISYTYLLTLIPLHIGYAITMGLGQIFVQVFAANILFKEKISSFQWLGIFLIIIGILFLIKGEGS